MTEHTGDETRVFSSGTYQRQRNSAVELQPALEKTLRIAAVGHGRCWASRHQGVDGGLSGMVYSMRGRRTWARAGLECDLIRLDAEGNGRGSNTCGDSGI